MHPNALKMDVALASTAYQTQANRPDQPGMRLLVQTIFIAKSYSECRFTEHMPERMAADRIRDGLH